jgi:2-amino-4-hydroxy-6-hydroxymethyldihydropteridine diphosphokinase
MSRLNISEKETMAKAFIAIGSNLGNRLQYIKKAVSHIKNLGKISGIAPLYESQPYGYTNQPNFLNSLLVLETDLKPQRIFAGDPGR